MPTIYDVAKAAGVSTQTVSRVLNQDGLVSEKTRALVLSAMADLKYVPSKAARTMRSRKSGLVGLISASISATPVGPAGLPSIFIVQGAQEVLAENGKTLLIADHAGNPLRIPALVQMLLEHQVEGLLYVAEYYQEVTLPIESDRPLVLANCFDDLGTPAVVSDNELGEYELVSALLDAGHRRIGFLTGRFAAASRAPRLAGYMRAHAERGVDADPALVQVGVDPDHRYEGLPGALDRLLTLKDRPSVICCGSDNMALRLYGLLRARGLDVPQDISVAGYDDYTLITEQVHPPLTSVVLPYREVGIQAARKLLRLINQDAEPDQDNPEKVSGPLVWRESTATLDPKVVPLKRRRITPNEET